MAHYSIGNLDHTTRKNYPEKVKTLVVGAGMSGLYSTWRIMNEGGENNPDDIVIFERSNRTGGRLDSDLIEIDGQTVKEEQGGMRFTFDSMDDLMALFLELDLTGDMVPFPMSSGGNNRLYFRGESFNRNQSSENNYEIWSDLYNLDQAEQGIDPNEMINTVFNRILDANPEIKAEIQVDRGPKFWQDFRLKCFWKGEAMKDWSLWNLLMDMGYSNECVTMLYRLLGFNGTFLSKMNAGVAYQLLEDFPSEPDFKTLVEGFSMLPNALVDKIGKNNIFLQTEVVSIDQEDPNGPFQVTYRYLKGGADNAGENRTLLADKIILGLPRLALEKLFLRSNALNVLSNGNLGNELWDTLQTTSNQPLLKINLYFDKAWWGNSTTGQPSVEFGPNFSDLPLGSVYPFYAIDNELVASLEYQKWASTYNIPISKKVQDLLDKYDQAKYDKPAALTIYCDYLNINFWKALQENGEKFDNNDNRTAEEKKNNPLPGDIYPASLRVVDMAMSFFRKLFATHYIPDPVLTSARIWEGSSQSDVPESQQFGYGVHQWALHADDAKTMKDLTQPIPGIFTCGEAFSDYQGWVEGALRSADLVLNTGWSLEPISEVYKEQHGGTTSSEAVKVAYAKKVKQDIKTYIYDKLKKGDDDQDEIKVEEIVKAQGKGAPVAGGSFGLNLHVYNELVGND